MNNYQKTLNLNNGLNPFSILSTNIPISSVLNPKFQNLIDNLMLIVMINNKSRCIEAGLILFVVIIIIKHQKHIFKFFDSNR